ncbi:MAG: DUF1993 domain-containing protein [Pseudomonadota bacterium]|uniref:DUF1993 domain-containing protein n=1 Tax=Sphingomonas sp. ERG5 TaxID=1381597 RepID=UPI00054C1824|nr:DUF1993 domain-containing protein [Sphingomonas sp. ERG5]
MTTSLYDLTVPVFDRALNALSGVLTKGEAFATEKGFDPSVLVNARLAPDMAPLTAQIQRVTDSVKGVLTRVGGIENVVFEDNETSFAELQMRIAKARALLASTPREALDGKETAEVIFQTPTRALTFTGQSYVLSFALPNIYFHVTTAYAILRHNGVPIGKLDYLGVA